MTLGPRPVLLQLFPKQKRPESQALPLIRAQMRHWLSCWLPWFLSRSPWFCFCLPVVVSTEHGQRRWKHAWLESVREKSVTWHSRPRCSLSALYQDSSRMAQKSKLSVPAGKGENQHVDKSPASTNSQHPESCVLGGGPPLPRAGHCAAQPSSAPPPEPSAPGAAR